MQVDALSISWDQTKVSPLGMALHKAEVSQALSLVTKRMLPSKRVATASQYILIAFIDLDCSLGIEPTSASLSTEAADRRQILSPVRLVAAASSVFQHSDLFILPQQFPQQKGPLAESLRLQGLTLKRHIDATLGQGNIREAVKLPPGEDMNEWLAVNTVDFYNAISVLHGTLEEFCTPTNCPTMTAGARVNIFLQHLGIEEVFPLPSCLDFQMKVLRKMRS